MLQESRFSNKLLRKGTMKKILLLSLGLALVTSSAQPVARQTLEKARMVTGIIGAIGAPAAQMLSNSIEKDARQNFQNVIEPMNLAHLQMQDLNQLRNESTKVLDATGKAALVFLPPALIVFTNKIISAALEKDTALAMRLMEYVMRALDAKHPTPRNFDQLQRDTIRRDFNAMRNFNARYLGLLTERENTFQSCSDNQAKAMGLEAAAALATELANLGLYKGLEKQYPGNDQRIKRRIMRIVGTAFLVGLLSWAKKEAAESVAPQITHTYHPAREAFFALIGKGIIEASGEVVASQIDEITQVIEEAQNLEITTPVVPQPQA